MNRPPQRRHAGLDSRGAGKPLRLETTESIPPNRLVRSIDDGQQFFRGRWEFDLVSDDGGCRLTITEHGEILKSIPRAMYRLMFDPAMYVEKYLRALAKKFGEEPDIRPAGESQATF